jgi:hypothetical protein
VDGPQEVSSLSGAFTGFFKSRMSEPASKETSANQWVRGGLTGKIHALLDSNGLPAQIDRHPAE